jgi:response regulator RpfG family c-di-GMP phosphodiesterase
MSERTAGRRRLLIVDDEVRILTALRRALRRENYEIFTAESGAEALKLLGERPMDIILSDHMMPGMSGLELLAEAAERQPEAVRLLITGWTESVPRHRLDSVGVSALIPKPWDDARLKQILRSAVSGSSEGMSGAS